MAKKQPNLLPKSAESEVEAYAFIRHQLRDLGWIVKDPNKGGNGQVWTQNQRLADPHIKAAFGKVRPENIVKLSEKHIWVIEAKATRKQLDQALAEAIDFYCDKVNSTLGQVQSRFGYRRRRKRRRWIFDANFCSRGRQLAYSHD